MPTPGMHGMGAVDGKTVLGVAVVGGLAVLLGYLIWNSIQERKEILKREGSSGLLKYEAGHAAIGVGAALAHRAIGGRADRNPKRKKSATFRQRELNEMKSMLRRHGYSAADARALQQDGMGSYELEYRLATPGDLERTHGLKRRG